MNERIKLLAEQAGFSFKYKTAPDEMNPGHKLKDLEKFAELIIHDCARIARATPAPNFHEHLKQQLGHTWDMACVEAGNQIIEEFK